MVSDCSSAIPASAAMAARTISGWEARRLFPNSGSVLFPPHLPKELMIPIWVFPVLVFRASIKTVSTAVSAFGILSSTYRAISDVASTRSSSPSTGTESPVAKRLSFLPIICLEAGVASERRKSSSSISSRFCVSGSSFSVISTCSS